SPPDAAVPGIAIRWIRDRRRLRRRRSASARAECARATARSRRSPVQATTLIGRTLGQYEVVARLGEGGMGQGYRGRDSKLNRDVALKVVLPAVANDPERLSRFKREAHVLASLNHPNIAAIYGFEDGSGVHALVMELVEGRTLADRLADGPIPLAETL